MTGLEALIAVLAFIGTWTVLDMLYGERKSQPLTDEQRVAFRKAWDAVHKP